MIASLFIAVFAGILLAFIFKVFVLVPATLLDVAVIVATSYQPKLGTILTSVGTAVLLQIGYILGLVIRVLLERRSMARSDNLPRSNERSRAWQWNKGA